MKLADLASQADLTLLGDSLAQPALAVLQCWLGTLPKPCVVVLENPPNELSCDRLVDLFSTSNRESGVDALSLLGQIRATQPQYCLIDSLNALAARSSVSACVRLIKDLAQASIKVIGVLSSDLDSEFSPSLSQTLLSSSITPTLSKVVLHPLALGKSLQFTYNLPLRLESFEQEPRVYSFLRMLHAKGWGGHGFRSREADDHEADCVLDALASVAGGRRCLIEWELRGLSGNAKDKQADRGLAGLVSSESDKELKMVALNDVLPVARRKSSLTDNLKHLSFDPSLTEAQRKSKEGVILPFVPEAGGKGGAIHYEADSNDDLDDSEPDEDLEI